MESVYSLREDHWLVHIASSFEEVRMYKISKDKEDGKVYGYCFASNDGIQKPLKRPIEEISAPVFPAFYFVHDISGFEELFEIYQRISGKIESSLLNSKTYSSQISKVIDLLVADGESINQSEMIIKTLIGENTIYEYKKLATGDHISFTQLKTNFERNKEYYGSLAAEIKIKSERIALLVSHDQTVGNYRELILRQLLKKYLPKKFNVATGFIEGISKQVDILIYDAQNHAPAFIEEDLVVVRREAVRAIIEVKSTLNTTNLNDTLQDFYDITRSGIFKPQVPVFKGIFAFESTYSHTENLGVAIKKFYTEPYFVEELQCEVTNEIQYLFHEISCVAVMNKHCLFTWYDYVAEKESGNIIPKIFSVTDERNMDVHTAMFINTLFDYLDVDYLAKRSLFLAYSNLYKARTVKIGREQNLTSDDWIPRSYSNGEHDGSQESIKARLKKVDDWFEGKIGTNELYNKFD